MRMLLAAAAAAAISVGGGASALSFGSIPEGQVNDALGPLFGQTDRNGWYGAELFLFAGAGTTITGEVLGSEAGWINRFIFSDLGIDYSTPGNTNSFPGGLAGGTSFVASGSLGFSFCTNDGGGVADNCVANGANPDDKGGAAGGSPNFFVSFENENAGGGQVAYLFFDDGGGANDDNHDDLVVKLSIENGNFGIVPLPAAGFLLLGGLGGLAALGRRKSKAKKA